jgi:acyl carrier protein
MLDRPTLTERVLNVVRDALAEQPNVKTIVLDDELRKAGLTSMGLVRLMLATEVAFDIAIPNEDLHPDNFRSARALAALVAKLLSEQEVAPACA